MVKKALKRYNKSKNEPNSKSVKTINSTSQNNVLSLSIIHIISDIINYLTTKDKIQLSSVCKQLRFRLEPSIFYKIKLFPDNYLTNTTQYGSNLNKRGIQSILLNQVVEILGTKTHFIKQVVIKDDFNGKFAKKFFSKFCHIKNLNIQQIFFKINILVDILKPLEQLEHFHLDSARLCDYRNPVECSMDYCLPKTIKSFKTEGFICSYIYLYPIQRINETHSNIQSISLTNPQMLHQFQNYHPKLVELTFSYIRFSDLILIQEVITNNPQITKLTIPESGLNETIMNSILTLKHLNSLSLTHWPNSIQYENWKLVDNFTITIVQFNESSSHQIKPTILKAFKNLQTIQFISGGRDLEWVNWNDFCLNLKLIEFLNVTKLMINFDSYIKCTSLETIILGKQDQPKWPDELMVKLKELESWKATLGEKIILKRRH